MFFQADLNADHRAVSGGNRRCTYHYIFDVCVYKQVLEFFVVLILFHLNSTLNPSNKSLSNMQVVVIGPEKMFVLPPFDETSPLAPLFATVDGNETEAAEETCQGETAQVS
jgi:hypothetical protein